MRQLPPAQRRFRRGIYLLPSIFTIANIFCGYACVVYAMRGEFEVAAPFIGIAILLDMLDGRVARLTGTSSAFGKEFDSLADVISFGMAPAILAFNWGMVPLGRLGWAAGFLYVIATAMRLARYNIQTGGISDKRYFVGMPSPPAAAVVASTVFAYPTGFRDEIGALSMLAVVIVPAFLMVSTIRFRSFKHIDLRSRRSYVTILFLATVLAAIATHPRIVLLAMAYAYLASGIFGWLLSRARRRQAEPAGRLAEPPDSAGEARADVS